MGLIVPQLDRVSRTLIFDPPLTDEELEAFCAESDYRIERTKEGVIEMNPPVGMTTGSGEVEIVSQLRNWWKTHKIGKVLGSSAGFNLPDKSMRSPDAAWISPGRLAGLTAEDRKHFVYRCPDFVVELRSPSDKSLKKLQEKMESWIANGALLGWLIDPDQRRVFVYQPGEPVWEATGPSLAAASPVDGFVMDLESVWECYRD